MVFSRIVVGALVALSLLCASCASEPPRSPASTTAERQETPTAAPPAEQNPFRDASEPGKSHGRHRSISEHPYAFRGRLESGAGGCDESVELTFANIKSLGEQGAQCTFDVETAEDPRRTRWKVTCHLAARGKKRGHRVTVLDVAKDPDESVSGGVRVRSAFLTQYATQGVEGPSARSCFYNGHVAKRAHVRDAK